MSPLCNLYCYTLILNHFHLLTKMKKQETIIQHFEKVKQVTFQPPKHDLSDFMMERFSNFLNSYIKAFNKVNKTKRSFVYGLSEKEYCQPIDPKTDITDI